MIVYGAILNIYWTYLVVSTTKIFLIFWGRFILGYIKTIVWDSNNLFVAEKHQN